MPTKQTHVARFEISFLSKKKCGIEYAIHTLRDHYGKNSADGVLLIGAKNAFNSLNRKLALKNFKNTCPSN